MTEIAAIRAEIEKLYRQHSLGDVAKALFVSSLWLGNRASGVKHLLASLVLAGMKPEEFQSEDTMTSYPAFREFCETLYRLVPAFPGVEDYVPEGDWGEVRFPFGHRNYLLLYGGELSSTYDHLSKFEVMYGVWDQQFKEVTGRSPELELRECLSLQEQIISKVEQDQAEDLSVKPGDASVPPERFWASAGEGLSNLDMCEGEIGGKLGHYTQQMGEVDEGLFTQDGFGGVIYENKGVACFFLHDGRKLYPLLPRRWNAILSESFCQMLWMGGERILHDQAAFFNSPSTKTAPAMSWSRRR